MVNSFCKHFIILLITSLNRVILDEDDVNYADVTISIRVIRVLVGLIRKSRELHDGMVYFDCIVVVLDLNLSKLGNAV